MFLTQRTAEREHFDAPGQTLADLREYYQWLDRINRLTRAEAPYLSCLPRELGRAECQHLTFLDVGAGAGQLGNLVEVAAATQGMHWEFTNLEMNPLAAQLNAEGRHVVANALSIPFEDGSFDVVTATTMTHHLENEEEVVRHFAEAWRVARRAVFIYDLHRNPIFAAAVWTLLFALQCPREIREDGVLSVKRGWRVGEWQALARKAGITHAKVWQEHGTRVFLLARKSYQTVELIPTGRKSCWG